MNDLLNRLKQYIQDTLGISIAIQTWAPSIGMPVYLRDQYRFFLARFMNDDLLLVLDESGESTPAVIAKHLQNIRSLTNIEPVYVRPTMTSYHRQRLIGHKVPFIIPGNQLYLPTTGIDLREHFKQSRTAQRLFSPVTQVLILLVLRDRPTEALTPGSIAKRLGYSAMSMSRAFDELEVIGIGDHAHLGNVRSLRFSDTGKQLWKQCLTFFISPVQRCFYMDGHLPSGKVCSAGMSALARHTSIGDPEVPVVAVGSHEWKVLQLTHRIPERRHPEPGTTLVELWKYRPDLFAHEGVADPLSVYLSLRTDPDERIQAACDTLLEGMLW